MKKQVLIFIFAIMSFGSLQAKPNTDKNVTPPSGWRIATYEDVIDSWAEYDSPNKVIADFNGDGRDDVAQILLNKNGIGYKVVAEVTTGNDLTRFTLDESSDFQAQTQAIELAEPSDQVWDSACEKGYWECEPNEIRKFKIAKPSIMHCYIEKACSIFMWSDLNQGFTKVVFSD